MVKAGKGHSLHQDAWNWGILEKKKEAIMTEARKTSVEEVKETNISFKCEILKKDTKELIYKTEIESQI